MPVAAGGARAGYGNLEAYLDSLLAGLPRGQERGTAAADLAQAREGLLALLAQQEEWELARCLAKYEGLMAPVEEAILSRSPDAATNS